MKKVKIDNLIVGLLFGLVICGVAINFYQQFSIDRSKLPSKVEEHNSFQRWITNLKNNDLTEINADDFELKEENEIYNTKWMTVLSYEEPGREEEFLKNIEAHKNLKKVVFSPSERLFLDYRNIERDGYKPNQVHFYGVRDDKIINARVVDCNTSFNCYFDRGYFLNNDVFVVSEFSRNLDEDAVDFAQCSIDKECEYTIKIHLVDLVNNKRLVYESKPFSVILSELIPEL